MKIDKNITVEDARELVSNRLLWPRIRDFLWDFAPQVHESWLEDMEWRKAADAVAASPRVKRLVLDSLGVEPCFHFFPKDDGSRIVLLDGATLESMIKWLGALACSEALRRVTSGPAVRELKAAFPGVYPEVFGYTMYFREIGFQPGDAEAHSCGYQDVVSTGASILVSVLGNLPSPLVSRFKLKLPKGLCDSASLGEMKISSILKLLKLKFPEAYKLCCS